jgi:hypothetical protein
VREIVIVIADLYFPPDTPEAASAARGFAGIPGIEYAGRFGERTQLAGGWREWLAGSLARTDLAGVAPACVAAAAAAPPPAARANVTTWIATAVALTAGLTRVHLDHRGILRLPDAEQTLLAADFSRAFGSSGYQLVPLQCGDFLLATPGIAALATAEPARCAGGDVAQALPQGTAAGPLRRLLSEIEMWLHGQALNGARRARGVPPVTALWLWGAAAGSAAQPEVRRAGEPQLAFGCDPYLDGLWHLQGSTCRRLPQNLAAVLTAGEAQRGVLVMPAGGELHDGLQDIDTRFVSPALRALRGGELARVTLIVNDTRVSVRRASGLRLWRRRRAGLGAFA